jgi:dienelactone hydrolase
MTDFSQEHRDLIDTVPFAEVTSSDVPYTVDGVEFVGYLAYPTASTGPLPTVLVIHDWTGLREYPKARAEMLARLGYAAFCVDVYGRGIRPGHADAPAEAGKYYGDLALLRSRVQAGYDFAATLPQVSSRVAVIGYCFGGSSAIEFARTGTSLVGAVSIHGGLVTHSPADVAAISAPLLILTGGADDVVPDAAITAFEDELRTRDDIDWQVVIYSGAPHAYTLPEIPNWRPVADARSWRALVGFLDEVFA